MPSRATQRQLEMLVAPLDELHRRALDYERSFADDIARVAPECVPSARNLLHYLAFRQQDLRPLQDTLTSIGLTSLGRMEPHALATLDAARWALLALVQGRRGPHDDVDAPCDFASGPRLLEAHAHRLLGPVPFRRPVRVMVTMPTEARSDRRMLEDLLSAGMDLMRINCAHDGPDDWIAMIRNLRAAERQVGRSCRVYADLAGPKLRTGPLSPGPRVARLRVDKDVRGRVPEPSRVWWTRAEHPAPPPPDARCAVPLAGGLVDLAGPGDELSLEDLRGRSRTFRVTRVGDGGFVAVHDRTVYVEPGTRVTLVRAGADVVSAEVGELPATEEPILLLPGDRLVLTREPTPGRGVERDGGRAVGPARIHCTLPEVFEQARVGEHVWLDDGKIGGAVVDVRDGEIEVQITHTGPRGGKLRAEKGINFPDSALRVDALTPKDLADLEVLAPEVDVFGLSFVRTPEDVESLHDHLRQHGAEGTGVVLKIESRAAFEALPRLLLTALRNPPTGVMVARGDLAVEVGFERLSEVQEEILWICEAAHVPVVWATQVLESLAKTGAPSRAEVTDAAMASRAECVMLNKGAHIVRTVEFLSGVLDRMHAHQSKKRSMLRPLAISKLRPRGA